MRHRGIMKCNDNTDENARTKKNAKCPPWPLSVYSPIMRLPMCRHVKCVNVHQLLSSLVVVSLVEEVEDDVSDGSGPNVHLQSRVRFRRPATGVSGHESLSDSDESRLSPVRGPLGRGDSSSEENADALDCSDGDGTDGEEGVSEDDKDAVAIDAEAGVDSDSEDAAVSIEAVVELELTEDSKSECAMVYLTVLISSSRGMRKETRFSAGKSGRDGAIFRGISCRAGLFVRIEVRLWGCL